MPKGSVHCPECGRFGSAQVIKEQGFCTKCGDEAVDEIMEEEARLDPHGPCGDGSRVR